MLPCRIAEGWVMGTKAFALEVRSMTPQQFDAKLAEEARDWNAAVRESGVKID
jgi:hypothetical protein